MERKKYISALFFIIILTSLLVACSNNQEQSKVDSEKQQIESSTNEALNSNIDTSSTEEAIDTEYVYFEDYPDVIDIVNYLGVDPESVNTLFSGKDEMIISFHEDFNVEDTERSTLSYSQLLESKGYELTVYDATISSTKELINKNYRIKITFISDLDEYKEVNHQIDNIDMLTENDTILFHLKKNN